MKKILLFIPALFVCLVGIASAQSSAASSIAAFNPAIGLVLNGTYSDFSKNPDEYRVPGFALGEEAGPGSRGFSLGESELNFSASVDNLLFANFTAALTPENEAEVEEAYIQTTALPYGVVAKGGRFFSSIGYANSQHSHVWDFVDAALPYRAMLANQYKDDGAQLKIVLPTDIYLEIGGEVFRGDGFPAGGAADNGRGSRSAFIKAGGDVGASNSWQAGVAGLWTKANERETGEDIYTGDSNMVVADFVWKWAPNGNFKERNFKLQAEYISREENGLFNDVSYSGKQRGWYAQAVYQFIPRWRIGVRHSEVKADDVGEELIGSTLDPAGHTPQVESVMIDFSNSEFSRFRVQYNLDKSRPNEDDHQWYLQYTVTIGAHGAHQY